MRNDRRHEGCGSDPWVRKIPWRREWLPTPVLLPGEFHGQRSLAGYSPWSHKESDLTKQLTLSLSSCLFGGTEAQSSDIICISSKHDLVSQPETDLGSHTILPFYIKDM